MAINPTIEFKKDKKGEITSVVIKNAALFYTKIQSPQAIYEQRNMSKPNKFEYSVNVVVTEDIADQFDEVFEKQTSKKLTNKKFKEKYNMEEGDELPVPGEKKQYVLNIKQAAQKADGSPMPKSLRPRVVEFDEDAGKFIDITKKKLIGNNSVGDVLMRVNSNDFGTFAYLNMVKVTDLIEYNVGGDEDREDFLGGEVEFDDDEEDELPNGGGQSSNDEEDDDDDDEGFGDNPESDGDDDGEDDDDY